MTDEAAGHTLIAGDLQALTESLPIEDGALRTGRLFKGTGVTAIRLSFDAGQVMREHTARAPILVQVLEGVIDFDVEGDTIRMAAGAIIHVEALVPHELTAVERSHVLLLLCDAARAS